MPYLPSLTALRCVDASARLGSFTRAAQELHLTQSAVSHHILALEHQLGVKLFARESGRVQLTAAGKMYWDETLPAIEQLQRATRQVTDLKRDRHTLTVSVPPSFANTWLMPRVCDFVAKNPDITLNLRNRVASDKPDDERAHAAIELSEGNAPGVVSVRLLSPVYRLYASPALLRRLKLEHQYAAGVLPEAALIQLIEGLRAS
jgi:DNA-binding transcriptional LysR family regulator